MIRFLSLSILSMICSFTNGKIPFVEKFADWAEKFNIQMFDEVVQEHIFYNWMKNDNFIDNINNLNLTYTLGHNQFSGMNETEFSSYLGLKLNEKIINNNKYLRVQNIDTMTTMSYPDSFDWREKGFNQPAQDQGQCGSCWTFSTAEALSGAYFVKYDELISFSKQQLVDCDNLHSKPRGTSMGCNGGQIDGAFNWIGKNNGLCLEEDYKYVSGETKTEQDCKYDCLVYQNSDVLSHTDVKSSSDEQMMQAISKQPVSVAIQADQKTFQLYKNGVMTGDCGTNLDHAVLLTGYGSDNGVDYYTIKNSWGTSWGEDGYIKIGRGDEFNHGDGQCGVLLQGSYPNL